MKKALPEGSIYTLNKWAFFLLLCMVTFLILLVKKTWIENETAAFEILEQQGEMGVFHAINTLQYISIPLVYLYKFTIISFIIWIGCFMFGYRISYSQTWHVALVSESIFLVPEIVKVLWFLFVETDPNIFDIRSFYPFSLMQLVNSEGLGPRYFYPLKALNIFEFIYWFLLARGLHLMAQKRKQIAYYIVGSSYVPMFFLWLGFYILVYK